MRNAIHECIEGGSTRGFEGLNYPADNEGITCPVGFPIPKTGRVKGTLSRRPRRELNLAVLFHRSCPEWNPGKSKERAVAEE
jgi:hypothetical protein